MRFMVSMQVEVPPDRVAEAMSLLPAEGAHAAEHTRQGILKALYTDAQERHEHLWR